MGDENKVEVTGTLQPEWEERFTPAGVLTMKIKLLVHEEWASGSRDSLIPCDLYGKTAEFTNKKMDDGQYRAGSILRASGSLKTWTSKKGYDGMAFGAWKVELIDAGSAVPPQGSNSNPRQGPPPSGPGISSDDIPF